MKVDGYVQVDDSAWVSAKESDLAVGIVPPVGRCGARERGQAPGPRRFSPVMKA